MALARGAFRRAVTATRAFDRIVAQHCSERCATMRSNARPAASTRRNAPRKHAPRAHHKMARAWRARAAFRLGA
eukprot:4317437-Lingulodinium_polyedra.AAC.1